MIPRILPPILQPDSLGMIIFYTTKTVEDFSEDPTAPIGINNFCFRELLAGSFKNTSNTCSLYDFSGEYGINDAIKTGCDIDFCKIFTINPLGWLLRTLISPCLRREISPGSQTINQGVLVFIAAYSMNWMQKPQVFIRICRREGGSNVVHNRPWGYILFSNRVHWLPRQWWRNKWPKGNMDNGVLTCVSMYKVILGNKDCQNPPRMEIECISERIQMMSIILRLTPPRGIWDFSTTYLSTVTPKTPRVIKLRSFC